jgi:hypothetical protein
MKKNYLESKWYAALQRASYIALTTLRGQVPAVVFENELKGDTLRVTAITCERALVKFAPGTWERSPEEVEVSLCLANAIVKSWLVPRKRTLDTTPAAVREDAVWNAQATNTKTGALL